ncbi:MAG TPA: cupredoxin family protein [Usitatibacter sp.]|nr:cupredoxin family protein [Usitatibacter sp.]
MKAARFAAMVLFVAVPLLAGAHGTAGRHADRAPKADASDAKPFGRPGDPAKVKRTIAIGMTDAMRYEPAEIRVRQGETVKLVVANRGKVLHEIVLGTRDGLEQHAELMRKFPGMEHDEPFMAHVKPGMRDALVWRFDKPGEFFYACLIPGHYEAGMVGRILVTPH